MKNLGQEEEKIYYKGAMEVFLKGSTSSTKFKEKEFEKVLSLDENSRIVKQICQLNDDFVKNRRNES